MNPTEMQKRVDEVEGYKGDDEAAHSKEDDLYFDLLFAISEGRCDDPAACAKIALTTKDMDFCRWCA